MKHAIIGCCYFPTTVVFIDDQESFLINVTNSLSPNILHKSFTKVSEFNEFLAKHPSQLQKINWTESSDHVDYQESGFTQHDISVNFNLLYEQIYNLLRYNEISVVVVDYAMPECNGIELCQAIKKINPNIRTLLLTGEADHKTAVDAFNKGFIDRFIRKGTDQKFTDNLNNEICQLAQDYFSRTFDSLNMNLTGPNPLLKESAFLELFNLVYKKHNALEYYLIDTIGGYLMLNAKGEATWLVVKDEENFEVYCELAISEDNLDKKKFESIKQKQLIPFYHGEYLNFPANEQWNNHLLSAKKLVIKDKTYIYAEDTGFKRSTIDAKKVHSFDEYLAR